MSTQSENSLHRIGRRCLAAAVVAFLVASVVLPWSAVAQPAEDLPVHQSSPTQPVTGVVVGPGGKPVAGAEVYLFAAKDWALGKLPEDWLRRLHYKAWTVEQDMQRRLQKLRWKSLRHIRTDAAGRFATELPPMQKGPRLLVFAEGLGFGYERLYAYDFFDVRYRDAFDGYRVRENLEEIRICLSEMMPIHGRLVAPDGSPAQGVLVRVRQLGHDMDDLVLCQCRLDAFDGSVASSPAASVEEQRQRQLQLANQHAPEFWPRCVLTDSDGSFRLDGTPQGWPVYLTLDHPEFARETLAVHASPGELEEHRQHARCISVPPTFRHTLTPARPYRGVVRAGNTGKPLSGVLLTTSTNGGIPYWHGPGHVYGHTDRDGRYHLSCYEGPRNPLSSLHPLPGSGYLNIRTDVKGEQEGPVRDIWLKRCTIVRGRVLDGETDTPLRGASVVYRPSRANATRERHFGVPVLTDAEGRFALTAPGGPGYLLVETTDRSYVRSANVGGLLSRWSARPRPSGLTEIMVPATGTLDEVVIRMKRGRSVTLQAVGPEGERLPWVEADWEANYATHDWLGHEPRRFPHGKVMVDGLDPNDATRVFLAHQPARLAAVFDVTPQTKQGPIEVRLEPTATLVGQLVTPGGKPTAGRVDLFTSFAPQVGQFTKERTIPDDMHFTLFYVGGEQGTLNRNPDGRFTVKNLTPGVPIGLELRGLSTQHGSVYFSDESRVITLEPLAPGQRRDMGQLTIPQPKPTLLSNAPPTESEITSTELGGQSAVEPQPADSKARSVAGKNQPVVRASQTRPIRGVVLGPDGKPVAGAEVYLFASKEWSFGVFPKDWPKRLPKDAWTVERQMEYRLGKPRWWTRFDAFAQTLRAVLRQNCPLRQRTPARDCWSSQKGWGSGTNVCLPMTSLTCAFATPLIRACARTCRTFASACRK